MIRPHRFKGVYTDGKMLFTINSVPGKKVYGERLVSSGKKEYRGWNPWRSKLSAYISRGGKVFPFSKNSNILYLGAASGTTTSHMADIASRGMVISVEFSPRSFRDLVDVAEERKNMVPVLADARRPETYAPLVGEADVVYQDISQRDQVDIFVKNLELFLKDSGTGVLMLKARSIDSSMAPGKIFQDAVDGIVLNGYDVDDVLTMAPFQKDHAAIFVHRRK